MLLERVVLHNNITRLACLIDWFDVDIIYYYNDPFYSVLGASETIELEFAGGLFGTSLDVLEIVIRVNCNDRWSFGETRSFGTMV